NKKRNCPQYNEKLDTLATLQAEFATENIQNDNPTHSKPL
ncbi:18150_t:CDS:1, partial [Racocetra persica]